MSDSKILNFAIYLWLALTVPPITIGVIYLVLITI